MNAEVPGESRFVPAIRVRHLWHRYGAQDVLRDVNLEVRPGEIFGFIGPNGAGKTTTIRVMATLLEPMAGRVEVDGFDVSVDPERVRKVIGYMPDHAGVYDRITIREYLEFFAQAFGVPDLAVVDAALELTDLRNLQDRLVAALSKGMKQRLGLARILLHDPKILILDEPASDLDPRARIEIRDLLLELREIGKTIFLSSHILTELSDVCTSVGILERGRLLVAGPIAEISERLAEQRARDAYGVDRAVAPPAAEGTAEAEGGPAVGAEPSEPAGPSVTAGGAPVPGSARRRLKLRVLGDSRAVVPLLEGGAGIGVVEALPAGQLAVEYVGDDRFVADVVRYLVGRGVGVVAVEPERNELERIFLEVTKGELQ
ncbi:MAG: ATP-binding cassette domain-containing protein [Polyangiaceae bacterium]|nr:ATP-binding cassette domain-containing protein [Polyangiaceae bacterium]